MRLFFGRTTLPRLLFFGLALSGLALRPIDEATLRRMVDEAAKDLQSPAAVVILRTPAGTLTYAYGTASWDGKTPVTFDDHVRVGSNTKTWTGTVILQMAQEGKLSLSDPVSKFRTDVPNGEHISIEQMLNMRSGLFNYSETRELNETLDRDPAKVWGEEELLALAWKNKPYFPPGEGFHYSNTNTVLLGLIAEKLDGKPLARIFQDRLFAPLKMTQTSLPENAATSLPAPHPRGYMFGTNMLTIRSSVLPEKMQQEAKEGTLRPNDTTDANSSWTWAAGGGISTANELVTWVEALVGGQLLNAEMQKKRLESVQPTSPGERDGALYGLGIAKFGPFYGHTGELPGFNSFMGHDPASRATLVVWTNLSASVNGRDPATTIARGIIQYLFAPESGR